MIFTPSRPTKSRSWKAWKNSLGLDRICPSVGRNLARMKTKPAKQYPPVGPFEKATSYCPLYIADNIVVEVSRYFGVPLPDSLADELAARAERVFAHQPRWRKQARGQDGREWIRCFMRHWLSGLLHRHYPKMYRHLPDSFKMGARLSGWSLERRMQERPALLRALPESFKLAHPLPPPPPSGRKRVRRKPSPSGTVRPFVHGSELLGF